MSQTPHWSASQMVEHLYGVGPEDDHIDSCLECRQKLAAMREARARREPAAWIPDEFFDLQRRQIVGRMSEPPSPPSRRVWLPAFATAAVLTVAVLLSTVGPDSQRTMASASVSDSRLYTEIYQSIENEEPRALAPMHSLFDEQD